MSAIDKVVGYTYTPKDHYGFIWTESAGMTDMGTLSGYPESYAKAINKKGEVVGAVWDHHTSMSAFYKSPTYKSGGLYAKAVLLTPAGLTPTAPGPGAASSSSAACSLSLPSGGYIFDNWNICGVKNTPTKDTTFTIDAPYLITFIATYHWNYGSGALPGMGISVTDSSGKVFGPWAVTTSPGSGGKANVNWECHPGIVLPAGTYTVIDPDPATQNDGSGNKGFVRVAGAPKK